MKMLKKILQIIEKLYADIFEKEKSVNKKSSNISQVILCIPLMDKLKC